MYFRFQKNLCDIGNHKIIPVLSMQISHPTVTATMTVKLISSEIVSFQQEGGSKIDKL